MRDFNELSREVDEALIAAESAGGTTTPAPPNEAPYDEEYYNHVPCGEPPDIVSEPSETAKPKNETASKMILSNALNRTRQMGGNELMNMRIKPMRWAVDGLIPQGLSILCGAPKQGKSIFALNVALSIAMGRSTLGKIDTERGNVLYCALEDTPRRLKERILAMDVDMSDDLSSLELITEIPRQHEGGESVLRNWCENHPNRRLIIIDTLARFRKPNGSDVYAGDYGAMSGLKAIADEFDVAILLVHHLRKAIAVDFVDEISGSTGVSGAADTVIVLKRGRGENDATLHITGRDVEAGELALRFEQMKWQLLGNAAEYRSAGLKREILDFLKSNDGMFSPKEIADALGEKQNSVGKSLRRMSEGDEIFSYCSKYGIQRDSSMSP